MQRSNEKLCLQWNDFQQNLTSAFRDLRVDKEFADVTLACEDGEQMEVHTVVLISSTPFFRNLFHRNKHPHPLIYMRGVNSEVLVAMIDFPYHGEANVFQEHLDSFLAIAEELQLKGLHGNQTEAGPEENPSKTKSYATTYNTLSQETADVDFKTYPKKSISASNFKVETNLETAIALNSNMGCTDIAELNKKVGSMMLVSENPAGHGQRGNTRICKVCGKEGNVGNISRHIEANHINGISIPCNICGKTAPTQNALVTHQKRFHK